MITVTLGRAPELTPDEEQQRIRRASEVLDGAGWLFDEHISGMTRDLLDTPDSARREELYHSIRAAADLKGKLAQIINSQPLLDKKNERRG